MIILAIETSCDDTAISIVEAKGGTKSPVFRVLAHNISSQIKIHQEWGGVVPNLAKREHGRNLIPVLIKSLNEAFGDAKCKVQSAKLQLKNQKLKKAEEVLERETELKEIFLREIPKLKIPKIDAIAVTEGPGLEPALWVGINFAKALAEIWCKPLIPINHLEGHLLASLVDSNDKLKFPAVALVISGGHTELILVKDWLKYKMIGQTRDDAVGEAFDKVARILGLPYPGGPEISRLAMTGKFDEKYKLPRPMIKSDDFDFSFSGLKTAVLYLVQKLKAENKFNEEIKATIAQEFQQATIDVLITKTFKAATKFKPKTLIIGGGVTANTALRTAFKQRAENDKLNLLIPEFNYSTDNATMIAVAAYLRSLSKKPTKSTSKIKAQGYLPLS